MKQKSRYLFFGFSALFEGRKRVHHFGFSLLEMAVVLAILGLLGFALWKFVPILRSVSETQPVQTQLASADEAVIGFIMQNHRLPCPAVDTSGNEAYVAGTGCMATNGEFPFRTLGVHTQVRLRYGVHQNDDSSQSLTVAAQRHIPMLPLAYRESIETYHPDNSRNPEWPLTLVSEVESTIDQPDSYETPNTGAAEEGSFDFSAIGRLALSSLSKLDTIPELQSALSRDTGAFDSVETAAHINGLDFCVALRDIGTSPTTHSVRAGGISVAYVIAHPGALDADGDGSVFDADAAGYDNTAGSSFVMPQQAATDLYDDAVLAAGFAELSERLSCPTALSRANGSAYAARAAYDNYLVALALLQFRAFVLDTAFMNIEAAESSLALSILNIVFTTASVAIGTAVAIVTADEGALGVIALVASIVDAVAAAAGIILEIVDMVQGGGGMDQLMMDLETAMAKRIEAEVFARKMLELAHSTAARAITLDAKGLLP